MNEPIPKTEPQPFTRSPKVVTGGSLICNLARYEQIVRLKLLPLRAV